MKRWILPAVLAIALACTGLWGYNQYQMNRQYRIYMDNLYQKSFYELVGNVGSVEVGLAKLMVSGDRGQHMVLLSEISRQADAAQADLGQLPVSHIALEKTSKFLNQLSDYAYYLSKKVADGKTIDTKEMENLQKLHENAVKLNSDLNKLSSDVLKNHSGWGELVRKAKPGFYEASDDLYTKQFVNIQKTSIDYPSLIYDGPFSEALDRADGIELKKPVITEAQARENAIKFVGKDRTAKVERSSDGNNGVLDTWGFNIWTKDDPDNPIYVSVSKKGGKIVNMIGQHRGRNENISVEEAVKRATVFLEDNGYQNMVPTYQQNFEGTCTINFAYAEGDIIMYPDLVKVKISLDNSQIYGFEARNYILAHKDRKLDEPSLSMEEARKLINPNLKITSSRMAVIPTESKRERFCYEFKGELGDKRFIVYIDANTGEEADILQIIETENGSLTM
ncbi:MAG TPA: germination protein YpeB [Clostridiales bacterium]|nr:germination protein YpeB [Clostridiales bacterium]